jgi:23S rRNA pseudouridine1911/1915/1917 synthase
VTERRLRVAPTAEGARLDRWLAGAVPELSRARIQELIAAGRVRVDGAVRKPAHRLRGGEAVALEVPPPPPETLEPEPIALAIVHEDEHILVVDKPAGLVVHPGAGHARGTLIHGLYGRIAGGDDPERAGIVHRLDRDTSGLMVVARSADAHRRLQALVRRRALDRRYLALVCGRPRSRLGRIEAAIGRDRRDPTRHSLDTDTPREAVTHFEVVELFEGHALLAVRLETGRTHQIRVHLEAIGLPVAGDPVYGRPGELGLERQFLHAARLAFPHPMSGERIETESPLPDELAAALERARMA